MMACSKKALTTNPPEVFSDADRKDLTLGCSYKPFALPARDILSASEPRDFSYGDVHRSTFVECLALAALGSLLLYGLVHAIGWIVGGFART